MRFKKIAAGFVFLIALASLAYFYAASHAPLGQPSLRNLTANADEIKNQFNAAGNQTRVLLLLSPT